MQVACQKGSCRLMIPGPLQIVVFSKSYCPFCHKAKRALGQVVDSSKVTVIEVGRPHQTQRPASDASPMAQRLNLAPTACAPVQQLGRVQRCPNCFVAS